MTNIEMTQSEADALLAMKKDLVDDKKIISFDAKQVIEFRMHGNEGREEFILNYTRYTINISRRNHHLRGRTVIGLARLDIDGPPHRNPDGEEIGPRHLHFYKEGYALKWARELPENQFPNLNNPDRTLEDFMKYFNVVNLPPIQFGLLR